jgi:ribosome-associated protein
LRHVVESLDEHKAEDIVTVDLAGKTSIADFMIIASGRSTRQVGALADSVVERLLAKTSVKPKIEGKAGCDWVLIDAGDVIVHVFRPEIRAFYNLEKFWSVTLPADALAI